MLLSAALIHAHRREWRVEPQRSSADRPPAQQAWVRFRRRVQASGMIGVLGVLISCFPLVPTTYLAVTIYLLALMLLVCWLMLLAIGDAIATRTHYRRLREKQWEAEARFASQLMATSQNQDPDDAPPD